jgi:sugar O-acyltransferase (sialic acid O-acetyltransferase NeuD family)
MAAAKKRVLVVGAGGHGAEVQVYIHDLMRSGGGIELLGFLDDGQPRGVHRGLDVLGPLDCLLGREPVFFEDLVYVTAVGSNGVRRKIVERMQSLYRDRIAPWTLAHPSAWIGEAVSIGAGTCIAPGAIVTTRVRIGRHCIVNVKVSISHDCVLGDYVNVNPGATICGSVDIGENAFIGTGATLINQSSVGENTIIGAGAVVIGHIPGNVTAVGVPARVIKQHAS